MKVVLVGLVGFCLLGFAKAQYASCDAPSDPYNGYVECPDGTGHFSMCVTKCDPGYVISGPSRQMCWCRGTACSWKGKDATCEQTDCDMPFFDNGLVLLADTWRRGFGGVVEFKNIPENKKINLGWSIVIVFDRPLGKNASISSWNTEMSTSSYDGQTFTLVNMRHNEDLSKQLRSDQDFRVLFVVDYVDGDVPSAAYVGLYDTRIRDASCVLAPKMPLIRPASSTPSDVVEETVVRLPSNPTTTTTTTKRTTTKATKPPKTKSPAKRAKHPRYRYRRPGAKAKTTKQTATTTTKRTTPAPTTTVFTTATTLPQEGRYCILQRASNAYVSEKSWTDRGEHSFNANAVINSPNYLEEWSMVIVFDAPVKSIEVWASRIVDSSVDGLIWTFGPRAWDSGLSAGETNINFIATTRKVISGSASGKIFLCSDSFTTGDALMMRPQDGGFPNPSAPEESEAKSRSKRQATNKSGKKGKRGGNKGGGNSRCSKNAKIGIPVVNAGETQLNFKANNDGTKYNYNELLHKSILFYEAQRSGKLPKNQRVPWRGDSGLKDGCDIKVDATGGWYDAATFIKYNFPLSFSLTTLAWSGIVFKDSYEDAGELKNMISLVKWGTKYLIKCHISKYEFIGQIGTPAIEDKSWGRPEEMPPQRKTYLITANKPGTELAAEAAAALAASSIFLKKTDAKLSAQALKHAKELYEFADTYRGMYHIAIPVAVPSYKSYSGYEDELVWSAAWLYKATNENKYLKAAGSFYEKMKGRYAVEDRYVWDRKLVGAQLLLADMTGSDIYREPLAKFLNNLETAQTTPKGMHFLDEWGPNRYTCGAAFIALVAAKLTPHLPREQTYLNWAEEQVGMILGDTGRSFVIGFGDNYPQMSTHRAASCPPYPQTCDWGVFNSEKANNYIIYGAMVGGTDEDGVFHDNRENGRGNHVTLDFNANFQAAIAGLKHFAMKGRGEKPAVQPQPQPTIKSTPATAGTKAPTTPAVTYYSSTPRQVTPATAKPTAKPKPTTTMKPAKTRPPVTEKVRCARRSPTGIPKRNAPQTKLNFKPNNDGTKHNYNKALHLSLLFFEAQMAGRLPPEHRIPWRGDSTLKDGCEVGADVSGGWFDAGDYVKFAFPMAFSLTTLAWGGIEFQEAYKDSGELQNLINTVKHGAEWFINAHTAKYELIGQVGNGKVDHGEWGRPETMSMKRPVYKITANKPGSELAAEAAAALAASSIFLKSTHPELSRTALRHAKELYDFSTRYRGLYHKSIRDAEEFYKSVSGYDDELIWGAAWLYKATKDQKYLTLAIKNYNRIQGKYVVETRYSWDRKLCGAQALLAQLTGGADYKTPFFKMIDDLMRAKKTPQGMHFLTKWGSNRYAAGAAFMAAVAAKMNPPRKEAYRKWAQKQVDLMLGDSGQSYVIGYGKYPKRPHHRSSSCPPYPKKCDWSTFNSPIPNHYILYGALVGGPDAAGRYQDKRSLYEQTEVTTDYNACFQSAAAGVKYFAMKSRGSYRPPPEKPKTTAKPVVTTRPKPITTKPKPAVTTKPKPVVTTKPKPSVKPVSGSGKKPKPGKKPAPKPGAKKPAPKKPKSGTKKPAPKPGAKKPAPKPGHKSKKPGPGTKKPKTGPQKPGAGPKKHGAGPKKHGAKVPCRPPHSEKCKKQAELERQRRRDIQQSNG